MAAMPSTKEVTANTSLYTGDENASRRKIPKLTFNAIDSFFADTVSAPLCERRMSRLSPNCSIG